MAKYPRDLEDAFKLFCRSTPEVFAALDSVVGVIAADRTIYFKDDIRPKKAQVLNAMILHIAALSRHDQIEAIRAGMEVLNRIMTGERPTSGDVVVHGEGVGEPKPAVKKRRQA